jgi:hypothetical protein
MRLLSGIPRGVKVTPWLINFPWAVTSKPEWMQAPNLRALETAIESHLDQLESTLGRPYANRKLPTRIRVKEVRGWLQLDSEVAALIASKWRLAKDVVDNEQLGALDLLADGLLKRGR